VDGKYADASFGRFAGAPQPAEYVAVLEGKGPRDPLDRTFGGRKQSAVEQALHYAVNLRCDWYLVTNIREARLYYKGHDLFRFERSGTSSANAPPLRLRDGEPPSGRTIPSFAGPVLHRATVHGPRVTSVQ
jgi:hypothetical protein